MCWKVDDIGIGEENVDVCNIFVFSHNIIESIELKAEGNNE